MVLLLLKHNIVVAAKREAVRAARISECVPVPLSLEDLNALIMTLV